MKQVRALIRACWIRKCALCDKYRICRDTNLLPFMKHPGIPVCKPCRQAHVEKLVDMVFGPLIKENKLVNDALVELQKYEMDQRRDSRAS